VYPLREEGGSSPVPGGYRRKVRGHTHKTIIGNRLVSVNTRGHTAGFSKRDCPGCRADSRQQAAQAAHEAFTEKIAEVRKEKEEA